MWHDVLSQGQSCIADDLAICTSSMKPKYPTYSELTRAFIYRKSSEFHLDICNPCSGTEAGTLQTPEPYIQSHHATQYACLQCCEDVRTYAGQFEVNSSGSGQAPVCHSRSSTTGDVASHAHESEGQRAAVNLKGTNTPSSQLTSYIIGQDHSMQIEVCYSHITPCTVQSL